MGRGVIDVVSPFGKMEREADKAHWLTAVNAIA